MAKEGGISDDPGSENSLEIENLARFAVDDYNKKHNTLLVFEKVLDVKKQVVAGIKYFITMEVKDVDKKKVYEATIWEKSWENFKEVLEFKLIGDAVNA